LNDVVDTVEPGLASADECLKVQECGKDRADEQPAMDVSAFVAVSDAEAPLVKVVSGHDTEADGVVSVPCCSEGVGGEAVCGLLIERLQDVSVCFVAFTSLFIDDCNCNLFVFFMQVVSLSKVGSKIIEGEGGGGTALCFGNWLQSWKKLTHS
jgi:hypothetical protein